MYDITFVRGDSIIKPIRFLHKGIPIMLNEGDVGILRVIDHGDKTIIEKRFTSDLQSDSGRIYISFDSADTETLEPKANMHTIRFKYEIEIIGANGAVFTPVRHGDFVLLLDKITPDKRHPTEGEPDPEENGGSDG